MEEAALSGIIERIRDKTLELQNFDALVENYQSKVFRFLLSSLRDRDAAETLTQETFLKAYRAREQYRGEASVSTWIMQIAVNHMRDHLRNRRWQFWRKSGQDIDATEMSDALPDGRSSPEASLLAKEQVATVWRSAGKLPERQRTVFLLRFVEEMNLLEIAAVTGMKEGTVKAHLFHALKTVRHELVRTR